MFIGSVSASDNETQVLSADDSNEIISIDNGNNTNTLGNTNKESLAANEGTFSDLATEIGNGGNIILDKDIYTYDYGENILINQSGTIDGNGAVIDMGGFNATIFLIENVSDVTLKNIIFKNAVFDNRGSAVALVDANCTIIDCTFINNTVTDEDGCGGAIYSFSSGLILNNCTFVNNSASSGGAIYAYCCNVSIINTRFVDNFASSEKYDAIGGAIYLEDYDESAIINCSFNNNSASSVEKHAFGGAIYSAFNYNLNVTNCSFADNSAISETYGADEPNAAVGGAIFLSSNDECFLINCSFVNNSACNLNNAIGGAVYVSCSDVIADNCSFVNNSVSNADYALGGAVYIEYSPELSVNNCNFINNTATASDVASGGSIYSSSSELTVYNSTFVNNSVSNAIRSFGGVVYADDVCTINYCDFRDNTADIGGALALASSFIEDNKITRSNFINNTASESGGAISFNVGGIVTYCTFVNNSVTMDYYGGGAIYCQFSDIDSCDFINNNASCGSDIYFMFGDSNVVDSNFISPNAIYGPDAVTYATDDAIVTFSGCYFNDTYPIQYNFSDLKSEIGSGGDITLSRNIYKYDFGDSIVISQPGVIDGNGATIDMFGSDIRVFNVTVSGVTFKNIKFKNTNIRGDNGSAILFMGDGTVINCTFIDNVADNGGAIYFNGKGKVSYCDFMDDYADLGKSIYFNDDGSVDFCTFYNADSGSVYYAKGSGYSFLKSEIEGSTESYIILSKSLYFYDDGDTIVINRPCVIDGNGTVIDMLDSPVMRIFEIRSTDVILKNITFKNAQFYSCDGEGAAVYMEGGIIENCTFINNQLYYDEFYVGKGGAVYFSQEGSVINSTFINNVASYAGGAVYFNREGSVENCTFIGNNASYEWGGGALYFNRGGNVKNSTFISNYGANGGAIYCDYVEGLFVYDSKFIDNVAFTRGFRDGLPCSPYQPDSSDDLLGAGIYYELKLGDTEKGGAIYLRGQGMVNNSVFDGNKACRGGAIYLLEAGNLILNNDTFINNLAYDDSYRGGERNYRAGEECGEGGAIAFHATTLTNVTNCNFTNNTAYAGGAIHIDEGSSIFVNNSNFISNSAKPTFEYESYGAKVGRAGAIYVSYDTLPYVSNCNFTNNTGISLAGAIYVEYGASPNVSDCNFTANTANERGGAIFFDGEDYVLVNCTFISNIAGFAGGAVFFTYPGSLINSIFIDNSVNYYYFDPDYLSESSSKPVSRGGAVYFTEKGNVTNSTFFGNNASTGSAIYFEYWNPDPSLTIVNSILLDNRADSESLNLIIDDDILYIELVGGNNLLNAIYSEAPDDFVEFDNVTYWDVNGVTNTDTNSYTQSDLEVGQNITVTLTNNGFSMDLTRVTNSNGNISIDLSKFRGSYTITAYHSCDTYYTESDAVVYNSERNTLNVTLTDIDDIYVDTPIILNATFDKTVNGTVIFNVNGFNYTAFVDNKDYATYEYVPSTDDTLVVVATFLETADYYTSYDYKEYTVNKIPCDINVTANGPICVGDVAMFTILMDTPITATVDLIINDIVTYYVAVVNGVGTFNVSGLANGSHYIYVSYLGDYKYLDASNHTTLDVNKVSDYPLDVFVNDIALGDDETIVINLPADVDSTKLSVMVDGIVCEHTLAEGVATVVVSDLAVGSHEVNVTYTEDDKYLTKNNNSNWFTVSVPSGYMELIVDNQTYGEDTTFTVILQTGASENVTISIDGVDYSVKPDSSVATLVLNNISGGVHTVIASYPGENSILSSSASDTFLIERAGSTIDVNFTTPATVGENVLINVTMGQFINGTVILRLNDENYTVVIVNGKGNYTIRNIINNYKVKALFAGNVNYTASESGEKELSIDKLSSNTSVNDVEIDVGELAEITVTVTSGATGNVTVTVGTFTKTVGLIDSEAVVYFKDLPKGEHNITAVYGGDDCYVGSQNITSKVFVGLNTADLIAIATNTTVGGQSIIEIILPGDAQGTVTIGDITENVVNGRATITLPAEEAAGLKTKTVTYNGDDVKYGTASADVTYNVSKSTSGIVIEVEDVYYVGESIVINVTTSNSTGELTVTINDEPYTVSDGKITISNGLPFDSYTIAANLAGDDNYEASTATASFEVVKYGSDIIIDVNDVYFVGESIVVNLTKVNSTGDFSVTINGKSYNVEDNKVTIADGLAVGDYNIIANLAADNDFSGTTKSADFTVVKNNLILTVDDITDAVVGDSRVVTVTLSVSDIVGNVIVSVNYVDYSTPINGNVATLTLNNLENITYTVKAYFNGNDKYLSNESNEVSFNVSKSASATFVEDVEIKVGEVAEITITVTPGATGIVTVTVNGTSQNVSLVDSQAVVYFKDLPKGEHNITAVYNGDDYYVESQNVTAKVVVGLNTVDIVAIASNTTVKGQSVVEIILPSDAKGTVTIGDITENIVNGRATITLPIEETAGLKTKTVTYSGDDVKYGTASADVTYNVSKSTSAIEIEVNNVYYAGEDVIINLTTFNSTGNLSVTINGESYNVTEDSQVIIEGGLIADSYVIVADLAGDDNYLSSTATASFEVIKQTSGIKIEVNDVYYAGEDVVINLTTFNSTGNLSVSINGESYNVTEDGQVVIEGGLVADSYVIVATLDGDECYEGSSATASFVVIKQSSGIEIGVDDVYYAGEDVVINLTTFNSTGNLSVSINGESYNVTEDGQVVIEGGLVADSYVIVATLDGDECYEGSSATATFEVIKQSSDIEIGINEVYLVGEDIVVNLTAVNSTGAISVTINGKSYNLTEDSQVIIEGGLLAGDYNLVASLAGDDYYDPAVKSADFTVVKNNIELTIDTISDAFVGESRTVTVILNAEDIVGNVIISVNEIDYSAPIYDNIANLYLNNLENITYTVKAYFNGNDKYLANESGEVTFNVSKLASITSVEDVEIKAGEVAEITITVSWDMGTTPIDDKDIILLDTGATGIVIVTVNNISQNASLVDSKAVVYVKDLTKGEYNITAVYKGDDKYTGSENITAKVTVGLNIPSITAIASNTVVGGQSIVEIILPDDAQGKVLVNDVISENVVNGRATVTLPVEETAGLKGVTVIYSGDDVKYDATEASALYNVTKATSDIVIFVEDTYLVGNDVIINLTTYNSTGNLSVSINGESYNVNEDSQVIIEGGLAADLYTIVATLDGDDNYKASTATATFEVVKKSSLIEIEVNDVYFVGEDIIIGFNSFNSTGTIGVTINGKSYNLTEDNELIIPGDLTAGDYNIIATLSGDDNYNEATNSTEFTVVKNDLILTVDAISDAVVGESRTITVTLNAEDIVGNVIISVNEIDYSAPIYDNIANLYLNNLENITYTVKAYFNGNDKYLANESGEVTFNVSKLASITSVEDVEIKAGEVAEITITVSWDMGTTPVIDDKDIILLDTGATGIVIVTVNNISQNASLVDSKAVVYVKDLAKGEYNITAVYKGDDKYVGSENITAKVVVDLNEINLIAIASNTTVGGQSVVEIVASSDAKGNVTIGNVTQDLIDGRATVTLPVELTPGLKTITVVYSGDNVKYDGKSVNATYSVSEAKLTSEIKIEVNDVYRVGEDIVINLTRVNSTGAMGITINGKSYNITDNKVSIIGGLANDTYFIIATLDGDDVYYGSQSNATFCVDKCNPEVNSSDIEVLFGDFVVLNITGPADRNSILIVTVDGTDYPVFLNNGSATLEILTLDVGEYNVTITYVENDKYMKTVFTNISTVTVNDKLRTDLLVDVDLDNATITVTLDKNATGDIVIFLNDENIGIETIVNGTVTASLGELIAGNYTIDVHYSGDDVYYPNNNGTEFEIPKVSDYPFEMSVEVDTNNVTVEVTLPEDINGFIIVYLNETPYHMNIVNGEGKLNIPNLDPGYYDIVADFQGNEKYAPSSVNDSAYINGAIITVNDLTKYYHGPERLNITVTTTKGVGIIDKTVLITINGVTYTRTTDIDGVVSFGVNLSPGNYSARIDVPSYEFVELVNIEVKHTVVSSNVVKMFRNGTQYHALYLDSEGNPLPNMEVSFNINGVIYSRTTNGTGWARLNLNLNPGEYILTTSNPITGEINANNITIKSLIESEDLTKYYGNTKPFVARIHNADGSYVGAGESVRFNVNGVYYTRTTNATGHVSLNINLNPGAYVITSYYKDCVKGDVIVIVPILEGSDLEMKYRDGSKFTVKLLDSEGRPNPGKVVTFNINGVLYNRTTDANGIARLNINLIFGEYIITTTYGGTAIANKITVTD